LETAGYQTKCVTSAEQAISCLNRQELQGLAAIAFDLDDGAERADTALSLLRATCPQAGFVALTQALATGDLKALLKRGVVPIEKPVHFRLLTCTLLGLLVDSRRDLQAVREPAKAAETPVPPRPNHDWPSVLSTYAKVRALSPKQNTVLQLHLEGKNDKEIAYLLGCSEATVYEHWRRIMKKAMVKYKRGVLADFHDYTLSGVPAEEASEPRLQP
jgi:DNA-binding NarL/FixJ family response regulator